LKDGMPMLTAEHEEAEVLRHLRLKAYAPQRVRHSGLRWLFELLGWRASGENRSALRAD
jgi:hypothetical protein